MIEITWLTVVELLGVGMGAGFYGTLVGLGGGFVIVPLLLLLYNFSPQQTIGTSLTVVFLMQYRAPWPTHAKSVLTIGVGSGSL